jgi:hypothetical protein
MDVLDSGDPVPAKAGNRSDAGTEFFHSFGETEGIFVFMSAVSFESAW